MTKEQNLADSVRFLPGLCSPMQTNAWIIRCWRNSTFVVLSLIAQFGLVYLWYLYTSFFKTHSGLHWQADLANVISIFFKWSFYKYCSMREIHRVFIFSRCFPFKVWLSSWLHSYTSQAFTGSCRSHFGWFSRCYLSLHIPHIFLPAPSATSSLPCKAIQGWLGLASSYMATWAVRFPMLRINHSFAIWQQILVVSLWEVLPKQGVRQWILIKLCRPQKLFFW